MQHIAQISENLFLGSLFSASPTILEQNRITYVFHLGFEIPKPNLESPYFKEYCQHEYFDLDDDEGSTEKMIQIGNYIAPKIYQLTQSGVRVLVCCVAGKSRSASMIVLYLHYKFSHASYDEILRYINAQREISINHSFETVLRNKFLKDANK